jgi:hypothetical protein
MGQRQSAALVDAVTGGKPLPPEVLAEILRKTDGTPLFVKELTKTVIGSGLLKESPSGFVLQGALSALAILSTLQDSLMARLDRLAGAKDVAQAGAAIGREFSHRLFAAVTAMSSAALDAGLDELVRAELVFRRGKPPDATYEFKHALVRDAAYQGMVRSQRALRHGLIAEAIRKFEPGTSAAQPELLAYRCQEAGQDEQAIGLWTQAGELATGRSSGAEATAHFDAALDLLAKRADTADRAVLELSIRRRRTHSLMISVGPGTAAIEPNAAKAMELADGLNRIEDFVENWFDCASASFSSGQIVGVTTRIADLGAERTEALPSRSRVQIAAMFGVAHVMLGNWHRRGAGCRRPSRSTMPSRPPTYVRWLAPTPRSSFVRMRRGRGR